MNAPRLFACGFAFLICAGCGAPPSGTVTGLITFQGEPVFLGTIAFHSEDGRTVSAAISAGQFHAEKVPLGPATLTVQSHPPSPQMSPPPFGDVAVATDTPPSPSAVARYVPLPARYASTATSELTYDVQQGEQGHDVTLVP